MHPTANILLNVKRHLMMFLIISLVINLLALTLPIYMLQVFDRILSTGSVESLVALTGIALLALVASWNLERSRSSLMIRLAGWIDGSLTTSLLPVLPHDQAKATAQDLSLLRGALVGRPGTMVLDAPWIPIFLIPLALLHPLFALYAIVLSASLTAIALWIDRKDGKTVAASRLVLEQANLALQLHSRTPTQRSLKASIGLRKNGTNLQSKSLEESSSVSAFAKGVRLVFQLCLLATGAWLVMGGALSAGGLIASLLLFARAVAPFEQMVGGLRELLAARDAWRRIALSEREHALPRAQPATKPIPVNLLHQRSA